MFRGSELSRLISMFALLAILAMLYVELRNPAMWNWATQGKNNSVTIPPASKTIIATKEAPDEDPEIKADVTQEFEAVVDGSREIQPEENFAYGRLLSWVQKQSWDELNSRAREDLVYADLMHSPAQYRGHLVRLDLNVRRVLSYDVNQPSIPVKRLYEIWGFTEESKAWLYSIVTPNLPAGMPISPNVSEEVQFVGYFFKLQGYFEADAPPRAAPLRAPLLVGRIIRSAPPPAMPAPGLGWWGLGLVLIAGVGVFALFLLQNAFYRRAAKRRAQSEQQISDRTQQWLREEFCAETEQEK